MHENFSSSFHLFIQSIWIFPTPALHGARARVCVCVCDGLDMLAMIGEKI